MKVIETSIEGVLILEPRVFSDDRGFFMETYHEKRYRDSGISCTFVQDNLSFSKKGILRGMHYQLHQPQTKLVQVPDGAILDVAVDIRRGSPTFGNWVGVELTSGNHRQLLIPQGFAHGFRVLSETAVVIYKCSDFYAPEDEGGFLWSDPDVGISWPAGLPELSDKDAAYPRLGDIPDHRLPSVGK